MCLLHPIQIIASFQPCFPILPGLRTVPHLINVTILSYQGHSSTLSMWLSYLIKLIAPPYQCDYLILPRSLFHLINVAILSYQGHPHLINVAILSSSLLHLINVTILSYQGHSSTLSMWLSYLIKLIAPPY